MAYIESKVYFDGSHYIGIPHTTRFVPKQVKPPEEEILVHEDGTPAKADVPSFPQTLFDIAENCQVLSNETAVLDKPKKVLKITKKQLFEDLYQKHINIPLKRRKKAISEAMLSHFETQKECEWFVEQNFERKQRNLICRRVRMTRKANLANFNYFCTFTYDNAKHTEETFKKKLKTCFRNMCYRHNWKYMGIWERAPKTNRLHFHGLFYIPENSLPGKITETRDYSTQFNRMQTTYQSSFFNKKFGRSDFKEINEQERRLGHALAYLMKYIEKTGEKIVYSKGLPQYFISDILEEDVVCRIGREDKKLLLFDNFTCLNEGCVMGKVCPEVIEQMRKSN